MILVSVDPAGGRGATSIGGLRMPAPPPETRTSERLGTLPRVGSESVGVCRGEWSSQRRRGPSPRAPVTVGECSAARACAVS